MVVVVLMVAVVMMMTTTMMILHRTNNKKPWKWCIRWQGFWNVDCFNQKTFKIITEGRNWSLWDLNSTFWKLLIFNNAHSKHNTPDLFLYFNPTYLKSKKKFQSLLLFAAMEQHVFCIFIDYRGHHRKGVAIMLPLKSIYIINFGFIEHKMYFWTLQRVSSKNNSIYWCHFCHEKIYLLTFVELPPICLC